jgi:hypothetical protein
MNFRGSRELPEAGAFRRDYRVATAALLLLGVALRFAAYAVGRPLWLDEASLSLNIGSRSLVGLTGTLDYHQFAPIPFLWGEWLVTRIAGISEYSLRALPLAAGVLLLIILWPVARRLLGDLEAVVAMALASISLPLIYYSGEVKQYGMDACVTVVLLALTASVLHDPRSKEAWRRLTIGGILSLWISQPSIFVLAGVGTALIAEPRVRAAPQWRRDAAMACGLWLSAFLLLYFLIYRQHAADSYLREYWEGTFLAPGAPNIMRRILRAARYALVEPVFRPVSPNWFAAGYALGALFAVGVYAAARRHGITVALLLTVPYGALTVASALGKYPIADRLVLFLAPLLFMVYSAALVFLIRWLPGRARSTASLALVLLLLAWRAESVLDFVAHPPMTSGDSRAVIGQTEQRNHGEPVYLYAEGVPLWIFYTTDWRAPDRARLRWAAGVQAPAPSTRVPPRMNADRESEYGRVRDYRGHRELIGLPSGVQALASVEPEMLLSHPDSGWAESEVGRLLRAGPERTAWLFISSANDIEVQELLAAVARVGGVIDYRRELGSMVYRVRFATPGTP